MQKAIVKIKDTIVDQEFEIEINTTKEEVEKFREWKVKEDKNIPNPEFLNKVIEEYCEFPGVNDTSTSEDSLEVKSIRFE